MNYILVVLTFIVLSGTMAGCAILATDRLIPGRRALRHISTDGIDLPPAGDPPLILSDHPDAKELSTLTFATTAFGYKREEVDGVIAKLSAENKRLAAELAAAQANGPDAPASAPQPTTRRTKR